MTIQIRIDANTFHALAAQVRDMPRVVQGEAVNPVEYALHVEYGTRRMRPRSMVRQHMREYERLVRAELEHALGVYGVHRIVTALPAGLDSGILAAARAMSDNTPVDTGRLKGAWTARLTDGQRMVQSTGISRAQASAIKRNRAAEATRVRTQERRKARKEREREARAEQRMRARARAKARRDRERQRAREKRAAAKARKRARRK